MSASEARVYLKTGKDHLPRKGNPWVFSGAVSRVEGSPAPGEAVVLCTNEGGFIARGHWNPTSQIRVRLLSWDEAVHLDEDFYRRRLGDAFTARRGLYGNDEACRLVFSEGDGLPGLILDRFGELGVIQFLSSGMDALRPLLTLLIQQELPEISRLYEKSDGDGRRQEGLPDCHQWLFGEPEEDSPSGTDITIREADLSFKVDPDGQKTGFYSDQRLNRLALRPWAEGRDCADVFCFSGAFACHLMKAGARSVVLADASADALALAESNLRLNGYEAAEAVCANAFQLLREWRAAARSFDLMVLDPPKLVTSRTGLEKGLRAYKDLAMQALHLLRKGGILAMFSCSGLVSREEFLRALRYAVHDSGKRVQILQHLVQSPDHPVLTTHPEGEYLKGVLLRITG